jgi:hypothetical protein
VVGWLGVVQAQDYAGAKWAVAQRTKACSDETVEQACSDGRILRTHVLRPTWHLVLPADIRWMLALSAPRIRAAMAFYDRRLGLTDAVCAPQRRRAHEGIAGREPPHAHRAGARPRGGRDSRRGPAARSPDGARRVSTRSSVNGARRGKQFTYALLDERAPAAPPRERDDALRELAHRYFTSHGPALANDFAWWSGLTVADARRARIDLALRPRLREVTVGGKR